MAAASGKVVIVGGGFGGATCARYLKRWGPQHRRHPGGAQTQYITCPFSNEVIAGNLDIGKITHGYGKIADAGVKVVHDEVTGIDAGSKTITLMNGGSMKADKLVVVPGDQFQMGIG